MKKVIPLLLITIVLVSGCIGDFDIFKSLFGTGEEAVEQTPDIIVMGSYDVIPTPPITAGNEFTVVFEVKNQDLTQSIEDVNLKLFDWGVCKPSVTDFLPSAWTRDTGIISYSFIELLPLQEERIELRFTAPTNTEIGYLETDCPVKWSVDYDFNSRSSDDFTVISKSRLQELQRAGEEADITNQPQYIGIGPVSIYFDFKTPMPVQSNGSIQFSVQIKDRGSGIFGKVESGSFYIKVPKEWEGDGDACTQKFKLFQTPEEGAGDSGATMAAIIEEGGYKVYQNVIDIPLIKRSTPEIICRFTAPDLDSLNIPEKSYLVSANITDYSYGITGEKTVHIEPSV